MVSKMKFFRTSFGCRVNAQPPSYPWKWPVNRNPDGSRQQGHFHSLFINKDSCLMGWTLQVEWPTSATHINSDTGFYTKLQTTHDHSLTHSLSCTLQRNTHKYDNWNKKKTAPTWMTHNKCKVSTSLRPLSIWERGGTNTSMSVCVTSSNY